MNPTQIGSAASSRQQVRALTLAVLGLGVAVVPARAQWTERVQVPHAAYAAEGVTSAVVHAGADFDPRAPLRIVVYLHGLMGCAEVLMGEGTVSCRPGSPPLHGWNLAAAHDAGGDGSLFVVPQLAFMRRDGRPGCFGRPDCFRAFLSEVLQALPAPRLGGAKTLSGVASITLVAHSAGYRAAAAILRRGGLGSLVRNVVLLDALYGEDDTFLNWIFGATDTARLLSLHIGSGLPALHSAQLLRSARRRLGAQRIAKVDPALGAEKLALALSDARVSIGYVKAEHRDLPAACLATVLRALTLQAPR